MIRTISSKYTFSIDRLLKEKKIQDRQNEELHIINKEYKESRRKRKAEEKHERKMEKKRKRDKRKREKALNELLDKSNTEWEEQWTLINETSVKIHTTSDDSDKDKLRERLRALKEREREKFKDIKNLTLGIIPNNTSGKRKEVIEIIDNSDKEEEETETEVCDAAKWEYYLSLCGDIL